MNADHAEACRHYATKTSRRAGRAWQITGIDPDGIDLALGDRAARLAFPHRVTSPGSFARSWSRSPARRAPP